MSGFFAKFRWRYVGTCSEDDDLYIDTVHSWVLQQNGWGHRHAIQTHERMSYSRTRALRTEMNGLVTAWVNGGPLPPLNDRPPATVLRPAFGFNGGDAA